jgi:TRAP-type mannitol/chloroaromatic compound transport system permease small subunit
VDILYERFSPTTKNWIEFLSALLIMVPLSFYIASLGWSFMLHSYNMGEISPDPGGLTHRFLLKSFVMSGFLLLGIQSIALTLRNAARLFYGYQNGGAHAA